MAKYHPAKEVSDAIEYALSLGWRFSSVAAAIVMGRCAAIVLTGREVSLLRRSCVS